VFPQISLIPTSTLAGFACIFGILVGSFLNVVILRYPRLLKHHWAIQSRDYLIKVGDLPSGSKPIDTVPPGITHPRSHCRQCKTQLKAWQNIPLLSFILLAGKCAKCKTPIALRYPLVELLTGVLTAAVVYHFGWSLQSLYGALLTWVLVALSFIDFDHQLLPDDIVLPTLWIGLASSLVPVFTNPVDAVIGAIIGYCFLWLVFQAFKLVTGKEGMGYGDFKLLALLGAWLGWQLLPQIILISTVLGSILGIGLIITKRANRNNTIPFGPYIAIAGWIAMLWGAKINHAYLNSVGLNAI